MVHIILLFIILIAVLGSKKKEFIWFSFFLLFLFAALRYGYGNDYFSNMKAYNAVRDYGSNPFRGEILFTALIKATPHYYVLIASTSVVFVFALYRLITRHVSVQWVWMAVFVLLINPYIFLMNLSAIRQSLAMELFIAAVFFSRKKRFIPYAVCVVLGALFHKSAIVLLPVYFWANENSINMKKTLFLSVLFLVFFFSGNMLNQIIEQILLFFDDKNYNFYFAKGLENSLRATLLSCITLLYLLINLPKVKGKTLFFTKLWLLGVMLNVLAFRLSMLTRIEMYFSVFSVVAFPILIQENIKVRHYRNRFLHLINSVAFPCLIVIVYFLRYYSFFTNPLWKSFTTYQTILSVI